MRDMDLPFTRHAPTEIDLSDADVAGGLVMMAAAVPVPEHGTLPALVYRFAKPDGSGFYRPIVLIVDEDQMLKTAQLTASAVAAAIQAASTSRG